MIDKDYGFFKNPGGEMLPYERYKLYSYIIKYKPKIILEVGAGVGGSTHFLCKALQENGEGKIYSCDSGRTPPNRLLKNFSDVLTFYKMLSHKLIDKMLNENNIPDFVFFDGPEYPEVALNDIKMLEDKLSVGTIFSMHDWCTEVRLRDNNQSTKAAMIKPYLNDSENWRLIEELSGIKKNSDFDDDDYDSVGMVFYEKIK